MRYLLLFIPLFLYSSDFDCPNTEGKYWKQGDYVQETFYGSATPLTSYDSCSQKRRYDYYQDNPNTCNVHCYDTKIYTYYELDIPSCPDGQTFDNVTELCTLPDPECTDNELLNSENVCVPFEDLLGDNFPTSDSNSETGVRNLPTTQEGCVPGQMLEHSLGVMQVLGWDSASQTCKTMMYKCNPGYMMNLETKKCVVPPDNTNFDDNICPNDNWGRRWTHDFCGDCSGTVGVWLPPLGHEESGMECNKAYVEYACVSDYRLKKYVEISCGMPPPNEDQETLDESSFNDSDLKNDINVSNLPNIDTQAHSLRTVEELTKVNENLKSLQASLGTDLKNINETLKTNGTSINGIKDNTAITSANTAATAANTFDTAQKLGEGLFGDDPTPSEGYSTGEEDFGEYQDTITNSFSITQESDALGLSSQSYSLPTFSFSILGSTFVIFEPSMMNGLPIAEIRSLILFVFALLGFLTVIRTI
jgi:hypothetical protein